jgi:hypothetical protein
MKANEIRKLLEAACNFATLSGGQQFDELGQFLKIIDVNDTRTVAAFVKKLVANSKALDIPARHPPLLALQLKKLHELLKIAGASKATADIASLQSLLKGEAGEQIETFNFNLCKARDYIPAARATTTRTPREDKIVTAHSERLNSLIFSPVEFIEVLNNLRFDTGISDARVKKIAKALTGKTAKTRDDAINKIVLYQNKSALDRGSEQALENVGV